MKVINENQSNLTKIKGDLYMIKKVVPILLLIAVISCFAIPSAYASLFSVAGGQGSSSVGSGGDYPTLYDASTDFDQYVPGMTGDWTLTILNSLNEYSTIAFGNLSHGHTFTMKPATSGVVVTLNGTGNAILGNGQNPGTRGILQFGASTGAWQDTLELNNNVDVMTSMDNLVIDGSSNGSGSQDLTIQIPITEPNASAVVTLYGAFSNYTIKNVVLNDFALPFSEAFFTESLVDTTGIASVPTGGVFINDIFNGSTTCDGVHISNFNLSSGLGAGTTINSAYFTGCTFIGQDGFEATNIANLTITNCTVTVTNPLSDNFAVYGIEHTSANLATGWTVNLLNNVFSELSSGANATSSGFRTIYTNAPNGTYNISNNVITGFVFAGTANGREWMQGIVCNSSTANYNVYQNSIYIASCLGTGTTVGADSCTGISLSTAANYPGTTNVENNIVEVEQAGGSCIQQLKAYSGSGTVTSNYNDFFAGANSFVGRYAGTSEATLANWQTAASKDASSQNVDPTATSPASWASPQTSLQFTPANQLASPLVALGSGVAQVGGITTDITGASRGNPTWPGAYDNGASVPVGLSIFKAIGE